MYCPVATMDYKDVIETAMNNFLLKETKDEKLDELYFFSSIEIKSKFKTKKKFKKYFKKNKERQAFFELNSWQFYGNTLTSEHGIYQNILLETNDLFHLYRFKMSQKYDHRNNKPMFDVHSNQCLNMYWRIDEIYFLDKYNKVETFSGDTAKNILNTDLKVCSLDPNTGYFRDGKCNTNQDDEGTHTVCAEMTQEFLEFTKEKGNDLITASPENDFPGLKPNDYWCLCALRYKQAYDEGINLKVKNEATHIKTKDFVDIDHLLDK